jgi:hypothetical protein
MYWLVKHLEDYLRKQYESWLLSENISQTKAGKLKSTCTSKVAERISPIWKKNAGKCV